MIEVSQLHKSFGQQQVLCGVDLQIDEGESIVIIGGSGCGKSVLLRHIIGLVQPDKGDVKIDGQGIANLSERELIKVRRKFGMLFQGSALFDSLTVEENVGFLLDREQTMPPAAIRETVADALELVDLGGTQAKKPAELSGGMKKRVGLARAIVYKPEIILYDEPTTGLDASAATQVRVKVFHGHKITLSGRICGFMKKSDQNMATNRPYTARILTSLAPFES